MLLEANGAWVTNWYKNDNNVMVRDFVFIDFCHWTWLVKQYAANGTDTTTVEKQTAYQMNPNTGEVKEMSISYICNRALPKDSPMYKELQLNHDCECCNEKWNDMDQAAIGRSNIADIQN